MFIALLLASARPAWTQQDDLTDLAARLEYAYYIADLSALQQSIRTLEKLLVGSERKGDYVSYLNYGRWKLAQLTLALSDKRGTEAAQSAAQQCNGEQDLKLADTDQAEQLALASACALMLETLRPVRGLLYRGDRGSKLQRAEQLAGDNPQVQLIAYWELSVAKNISSAERLAKAAAMASRYEAAGSTRWGSAEAWYLLALAHWEQRNREQKNLLEARDALEKALLLAPDYLDAQVLMKKMSLAR